MADLTRFWIVPNELDEAPSTPSGSSASYRVESTSEGDPSVDGRTAPRSSDAKWSARSPEGASVRASSFVGLLDALAPMHGGLQVQLRAPREVLAEVMSHALGVVRSAGLEHARNVVVDWPTRAEPTLRCAFIGLDLDWSPPPPPVRVARFPGGPGSAASKRQ